MQKKNSTEQIAIILSSIGSLFILSTLFIETNIDLGNIGVIIITIALSIYLFGNKFKATE